MDRSLPSRLKSTTFAVDAHRRKRTFLSSGAASTLRSLPSLHPSPRPRKNLRFATSVVHSTSRITSAPRQDLSFFIRQSASFCGRGFANDGRDGR